MTTSSSNSSKEKHQRLIDLPGSCFARGAFGEISLGLLMLDDDAAPTWIALKTTCDLDELQWLQRLPPQDNLVSLLGVVVNKQANASVMTKFALEYGLMDLQSSLDWRQRQLMSLLSLDVVHMIAYDLFSALSHLSLHNIVHGDVKCGNLLVCVDGDTVRIKLCDFGLAQDTTTVSTKQQQPRGLTTLYYRPPELLLGGSMTDTSVDIYSAGAVLAQVLTGSPLFRGTNVLTVLSQVLEALGSADSDWTKSMSQYPDFSKIVVPTSSTTTSMEQLVPRATEEYRYPLLDIMKHSLVLDPLKRWTASHVLEKIPKPHRCGSSSILVKELVPKSLRRPPLVLSSPVPDDWTVANRQAVALASLRRKAVLQEE